MNGFINENNAKKKRETKQNVFESWLRMVHLKKYIIDREKQRVYKSYVHLFYELKNIAFNARKTKLFVSEKNGNLLMKSLTAWKQYLHFNSKKQQINVSPIL